MPSTRADIFFLAPSTETSTIFLRRPTTKSAPIFSASSITRSLTLKQTAALARVSLFCMRSSRTMFTNMSITSVRIRKFSPSFMGGTFKPSSYLLLAEGGMPPGSDAPVSGSWPATATQAISSRS